LPGKLRGIGNLFFVVFANVARHVIQAGGNILPIEVKASGKGSMQSLWSYLSSHTLSPFGVRVSLENYGSYDDIRVCPVYSAHKIRDISI
jgi:hypothetical protein